MPLYNPSDLRTRCSDGTNPATAAAPGTLRDLSENWRSGGDISVSHMTDQRGVANREQDEHVYIDRYAVAISQAQYEQDDRSNGSSDVFVFSNARTANLRAFQREYRASHTRTVAALVSQVADAFDPAKKILMNVDMLATGPLVEAGF